MVNCIFVNIPKHISCQVFVRGNVSHWFLNTFQFVFNNPFLPGVILLMGLLAVQISEPSLIQFEYLRLQLYINNVGQGQTGKRQNSPLFSFINGIKTKYLLFTIDQTEYRIPLQLHPSPPVSKNLLLYQVRHVQGKDCHFWGKPEGQSYQVECRP